MADPTIEPEQMPTPEAQEQNSHRVVLDPSTPPVRSIVRVVVITLLLLGIAGFVQTIVSSLSFLFFVIVLSVFFAYLIDPLVQIIRTPFIRTRRERLMPRSLAIFVAYAFVFTILGVAIAYIAPRVGEQAREFGANLPAIGNAIRERGSEINTRFDRLRVPDEVQEELNRQATELGGRMTAGIGSFVLLFVGYLPWFLLIPILAFFFLKDANLFRLSILRIFPAGRWRIRAESVMADVNTTLAAYTRAQIISSLIISTICTVGFYLIDIKYALLLGILAGIFEFVPLLGPATIGLIVILTAAASDNPRNALYAAIFLVALRIVHDYVTYPRIVRGGIHLHPLAIILAVLAGEQVAGIPGVFISIPIVAVATVIYRHVLEHQGRKGLLDGWFGGPENPADPQAPGGDIVPVSEVKP
ncbi:MAG: AI-2E family transporter [Pyrinomonadaceae bacterium]